MSTFATVKTTSGTAGLRDLASADLPAIVDYWLRSPDEFLTRMGVDRAQLGAAEDIHRRFLNAIRSGDPDQRSISLGITLDEQLVGYTLLNRYSADVNYSHWHIMVSDQRAKGISTTLYPYRVKAYFDVAPLSQLIHQTRTSNVGMNRVLDKYVPISETKYIEKPDGVASPGEFHLRYVKREDLPRIFARAVEQGTIPSSS
jgi:hypothetical protein